MSVRQRIALSVAIFLASAAASSAEGKDGGYWIDPSTHLMWAIADNASGISLLHAKRYCRESSLGGFTDWRLPSIDELQQVFGGPEDEYGRHVTVHHMRRGYGITSIPLASGLPTVPY